MELQKIGKKVFAGGLWDEDTKLVRFGVRDYDPEVGRWTSKEPLGFAGSRNFYVYAGNDSMNFVDLDGFQITVYGSQNFKNKVWGLIIKGLLMNNMYSKILDDLLSDNLNHQIIESSNCPMISNLDKAFNTYNKKTSDGTLTSVVDDSFYINKISYKRHSITTYIIFDYHYTLENALAHELTHAWQRSLGIDIDSPKNSRRSEIEAKKIQKMVGGSCPKGTIPGF